MVPHRRTGQETIARNTRFIQTRLDASNWEEDSMETYGDWPMNKEENTTRLAFVNVGGTMMWNHCYKKGKYEAMREPRRWIYWDLWR